MAKTYGTRPVEILFPLGNLSSNAALVIDDIVHTTGRKWEIDQEIELEKIKYKSENQKFELLLKTIAATAGVKIR